MPSQTIAHAGQMLAALRKESGLTQVEMARALGIVQSRVSAIERQGTVDFATLRRYVEKCGLQFIPVVNQEPKPK